ncbi:MAG: hypothetical protein WC877_00680 [Dehalococcoidales bacterium]|jgi:hypothetical protein
MDDIKLTRADLIKIILIGIIGGVVGSFISLLIRYLINLSGIMPGF